MAELLEKVGERTVPLYGQPFLGIREVEMLVHETAVAIATENKLQRGGSARVLVSGMAQYEPDEKPIE